MFLGPYYPNVFNTWFTSIVSTVTLSLAEVEAEYDKVRFHTSYTVLGIVIALSILFDHFSKLDDYIRFTPTRSCLPEMC